MKEQFTQPLRSFSKWMTQLAIIGPALLIGGTRSDVQLLIAGLLWLALVAKLLGRWRSGMPMVWPVWVFASLAIYTVFQTVSLPISWVQVLSPKAASLYLAYDPNRLSAPLSVAPIETARTALLHLSLLSMFLLVSSHGKRNYRDFAWSIILVGGLSSAVAFVHLALGLDQIYGVYSSVHRSYAGHFFGPFINENTMAGLLNLACLTGLGMTLNSQSSLRTKLASMASVMCAGAVFWGHSRGGQLALVIGLIAFGVVAVVVRLEKNAAPQKPVRKVFFSLMGFVGLGVAGIGLLLERFTGVSVRKVLDEPKFDPLKTFGELSSDYPWFGSGRGSFSAVYPQYQANDINGFVTHPENIVVQYIAEWGLVVGLVALICGVLIGLDGLRNVAKEARYVQWGLWAGLLAVCLQQFVDFGLESMGLAAPTVAAAALLFTDSRPTFSLAASRIVALGTTLILGVALVAWAPTILSHQHDGVLKALKSDAKSGQNIELMARKITHRNPADYLAPMMIADAIGQQKPLDMGGFARWINHAQRLFPQGGQAHHLAARVLASQGYAQQATGEYRRAYEKQPWKRYNLIAEVVEQYNSPQLLLRAVPDTVGAHKLLLETLFRRNEIKRALALVDEILTWSESRTYAHTYKTRALYSLRDIERLKVEARWFMEHGRLREAHILLAKVALLKGDREATRRHIQDGLRLGGDKDIPFLRQAARCYRHLNDRKAALNVLNHLWNASTINPSHAADTLELRGSTEEYFGQFEEANQYFERAFTLRPLPTIAVRIARVHLKQNNRDKALKRLESAYQMWPRSKLIKSELKTLIGSKKRGETERINDQD